MGDRTRAGYEEKRRKGDVLSTCLESRGVTSDYAEVGFGFSHGGRAI